MWKHCCVLCSLPRRHYCFFPSPRVLLKIQSAFFCALIVFVCHRVQLLLENKGPVWWVTYFLRLFGLCLSLFIMFLLLFLFYFMLVIFILVFTFCCYFVHNSYFIFHVIVRGFLDVQEVVGFARKKKKMKIERWPPGTDLQRHKRQRHCEQKRNKKLCWIQVRGRTEWTTLTSWRVT